MEPDCQQLDDIWRAVKRLPLRLAWTKLRGFLLRSIDLLSGDIRNRDLY